MDKDQVFQVIEHAKQRLLTDEEVKQVGEWAEAELAAEPPGPLPRTGEEAKNHPIVEWITAYTKGTRSTEHFEANFKKVSHVVMPCLTKVFHPPGSEQARQEKAMDDEREWHERRESMKRSRL